MQVVAVHPGFMARRRAAGDPGARIRISAQHPLLAHLAEKDRGAFVIRIRVVLEHATKANVERLREIGNENAPRC